MTQPEILVAGAHQKFDRTGTLIDQATRGFLATFREAFSAWVGRFASSRGLGERLTPDASDGDVTSLRPVGRY
jgi:hypothetical protein